MVEVWDCHQASGDVDTMRGESSKRCNWLSSKIEDYFL